MFTSIKNVLSIVFWSLLLMVGLPPNLMAAHKDLGNGFWRVYISKNLVPPGPQQTPVWCWAASLSNLFGYYGHPVDQQRIATRYFPPPIVTTGPPIVMMNALNTVSIPPTSASRARADY